MKSRNKPSISLRGKIRTELLYAGLVLGFAAITGIATFVFVNFGKNENAMAAATYNTTPTGGNWATGSTWAAGSAPANWGNHTVYINGDVSLTNTTTALNGFSLIRLNNGKSFTSGTSSVNNNLSMQNVTFNVMNGNVTVYGNLTLNNTALTVAAGDLTVTGTLSITNGSSVTFNSSGTVTAGAVTSSGSGGTLTMNSGTLSVTNAITINSATTVTIGSTVTATAGSLSSSNNSNAILNNNGTLTVGSVAAGGVINNNGTLNVNGNLTSSGSGSSVTTNFGTLNVSGDMSYLSSGKFYGRPGGKTVVNGNVRVGDNLNLVIGTNAAPPPYADLVVGQDLIATGSGDVLFDRNARVAIFGNVTDSGGGGTLFTVNNGGQVYVDGNITYTGGGNVIGNSNATNPYGLYVNGSVSNSGGGSATTSNMGNLSVLMNTNTPFFNWISGQMNSPLPITLVSFIAEAIGDIIALDWSTASEENFEKFVVERSATGISFEDIGEVIGAGNSKEIRYYTFEDQEPLYGINYYRLKSVDLDGKFEYSGVVYVRQDAERQKNLVVYPNPSTGQQVNFKTNFSTHEEDVISIMDLRGTEILRAAIAENHGQLNFGTPLKPGAYLVKYSSVNFSVTKRLLVSGF